ncbi:DUF1515 domain-containing protein, partial [Rhizobium ruizarguesonis]
TDRFHPLPVFKRRPDRVVVLLDGLLEEWKRMKTIGYGISGLIAFAGLTIGGMIAYASDGAVAALRHWLKIN